jgi:hypothetical protein
LGHLLHVYLKLFELITFAEVVFFERALNFTIIDTMLQERRVKSHVLLTLHNHANLLSLDLAHLGGNLQTDSQLNLLLLKLGNNLKTLLPVHQFAVTARNDRVFLRIVDGFFKSCLSLRVLHVNLTGSHPSLRGNVQLSKEEFHDTLLFIAI